MSIRTLAAALALVALPTLAPAAPLADGIGAVEEQLTADKLGDGRAIRKLPGVRSGDGAALPVEKPGEDVPLAQEPRPDGKAAAGRPERKPIGGEDVQEIAPAVEEPAAASPIDEAFKPSDRPREGRPGRKDFGKKLSQGTMPSAQQIERQLEAAPRIRVRPEQRVTIREFKKRPDLRRNAPAIDIQSINFTFGSAEIPYSQYGKIENIADAMERILRRDRRQVFLLEGHTDAVGSWGSNLRLSEARAASLRSVLVNEFGIPRRALETVGYGEEFLLVPTQDENWRNRRVTLRRITDQIVPF